MHVRFMFLHFRIKRVMPITRRGIKRGKEQRAVLYTVYLAKSLLLYAIFLSRNSFGLFKSPRIVHSSRLNTI